MADCQINITSVLPMPPGSPTTSIQVSGTAANCLEVELIVECVVPGTPTTPVTPPPTASVSNGHWTATVPLACNCGDQISVIARCIDADCQTPPFVVTVECGGPSCPTAVVTASVGGCNSDGTRTVTLTASITNPGSPGTAYWAFGDGASSFSSPFLIPGGSSTNSQTHAYQADQTYTAALEIFSPAGCPSILNTFTVEACPCPQITDVLVNVQGCVDPSSGKVATATFTAITSGPTAGCSYEWGFGDGSTATTSVPSVSHDYHDVHNPSQPNEPYPAAVSIYCPIRGTTCHPTPHPFTVPIKPCCPQLTGINFTFQQCATASTPNVSFNPVPSPAGTYTWDFGDGHTSGPLGGPGGTSHQYDGPRKVTVTVTYTPDPSIFPGCPPQSNSTFLDIPACPGGGPPPPPSGGNGDGNGNGCLSICGFLLALAIGFIIAGAGLIEAGLCSGIVPMTIAGGVAMSFGTAILLAWGFFCARTSCKTLITTLITFQVLQALAALAGWIVSYFMPSCGVGMFVDSGAFGVVVTLLFYMGRIYGCIKV